MNQFHPIYRDREDSRSTDPAIHSAHHATELGRIHDAGTAMVILKRKPNPALQDWVAGLDPARLPKARCVLLPDHVPEALAVALDAAQTPRCAVRDVLARDIEDLARQFVEIMRAPFLRLRLDVITTNACRKFHVDAITARLICTYRGTGTQYGFSRNGNDPEEIFVADTGAPLVLRGTKWQEKPASGLLHRSPPIEGSGETRLVLVLDPMDHAEEEI